MCGQSVATRAECLSAPGENGSVFAETRGARPPTFTPLRAAGRIFQEACTGGLCREACTGHCGPLSDLVMAGCGDGRGAGSCGGALFVAVFAKVHKDAHTHQRIYSRTRIREGRTHKNMHISRIHLEVQLLLV